MTGTTYQTPNSARFGIDSPDGTENLGTVEYDHNDQYGQFRSRAASGKVIPIGHLYPEGIHSVLTNGWEIKRQMWRHDYTNGVPWAARWQTYWTDDPTYFSYKRYNPPDEYDQNYDLDAPDIWQQRAEFGITDSCERYDNFRQWIEWNGVICSEYAPWRWFARWKYNPDKYQQITLKELNNDNQPFPSGPYYSPP